jgi:hypothetical protein
MNNNGWQRARHDAGLPLVRVHDLRHSFACRLRAAGVSAEDREALLGHANHSMAGHYASADVGHLLAQANLIVERRDTRTVLRIADSRRGPVREKGSTLSHSEKGGPGFSRQALEFSCVTADRWIKGPTTVPQQLGGLGFRCQVFEFWRARQDSNHDPLVRRSAARCLFIPVQARSKSRAKVAHGFALIACLRSAAERAY